MKQVSKDASLNNKQTKSRRSEMQIFNNVPAFGVWVNYASSVQSMRSSMDKLSSGLRIRTAADDPAGLAMSERMRSQIRGSSMAAQNIQNAQAYMRTADSWMQKIHDMLHRMNELAVSANDGTKTLTDRANLQAEFEQMQEEITRITSGPLARGKFNTANLFSNGAGLVSQIGADPGQLFCGTAIDLRNTNGGEIGTTDTVFDSGTGSSVNQPISWSMVLARGTAATGAAPSGIHISTPAGAQRATAVLKLAIDHVSSQRAVLGAQASRLAHSLDGIRAYQENIMGAESQIRDVDMALESTQFMKYQILTQVGTAMLAQANALPQSVLQLIG
jgi:flagellin